MNGKITIHRLSEKVAENAGVSQACAEGFIKALFEAASVALENGENVEIDGIGTFRRGEEPENPVILIPSVELAREVNSPFDMFEPQKLLAPEGVIESVESDVEITAPDTVEPISSNTCRKEDSVQQVSAVAQTAEVRDGVQAPTSNGSQLPPVIESIPPVYKDKPHPSPVISRPPKETNNSVDDENRISENSSTPLPAFPEEELTESEDSREKDESGKSRFGIGFFLGLLCGIALGAVGMFLIFLISTKMYSSEALLESQEDLELTQEALSGITTEGTSVSE